MHGLVVGVDPLDRNLFRAALELLAIPSGATASVGQARLALSSTHADVVVVVEGAGDLEGLAWIRELRARGWRGHVVYATALLSDEALRELNGALHAPTVLLEPFELNGVMDRIQAALPTASRGEVHDEGEYPAGWNGTLARVREQFGQSLGAHIADVVADVEGGVAGASASVRATVAASWRVLAAQCADLRFTLMAEVLGVIAAVLVPKDSPVDAARLEAGCVLMHTWVRAWRPHRQAIAPAVKPRHTALCVADDRRILMHLADWFELRGLGMVSAGSMMAARALARTMSIDFALLADDIPDDGLERLVEYLHGQDATASLPIGVIASVPGSASAVTDALRHERLAGVVSLPLDDRELGALVRKLTDGDTGPAVRVLLVSADSTFVADASEALARASCEVAAVSDPAALDDKVRTFEPHVVVSEVLLPTMSGLDVCRRLHAGIQRTSLPVLLAVEHDSVPLQIAMARAGVFGSVIRPVHADELVAKVLSAHDRVAEIEDQDPTTGTLRRNAFHRRLHERMRRSAPDIAVGLVDLDFFHDVNHLYGFAAGDRVLVALVSCIRQACPEDALVGRWGADRVVVALDRESRTGAQTRLANALSAFGALVFTGEGGAYFRVSAQGGVAASGRSMCGADALMLAAEDALTDIRQRRAAS